MGAGPAAALDGFFHLVASQVATRLITFSLNLLAARSLTPEAYGVAAVQFHLINTAILFLSREGFRRACLRVDAADPAATANVLSAGALTVPLGAALSAGLTGVLLRVSGDKPSDYRQALVMQGAAAFLELLAEPLYLLASSRLLFRLRVAVETGATLLKSAVVFCLVELGASGGRGSSGAGSAGGAAPASPALAFSWAQLAYAAATLAGYAAYFLPQLLDSRRQAAAARRGGGRGPGKGARAGEAAAAAAAGPRFVLDWQLLRLAGAFSLQAAEKLLLAEGSKMAMAAAQSAYNQGVYGLVNNLGSLVVRTLFQPFEEAAFAAFSKAQGQRLPSPADLAAQARLLALLVRSISLVGLAAAAFGPAYSHLLLLLAYGQGWADSAAPAALGLYACYVALLAVNGILEAFVHSVASERQLQRANAWLVAFAAVHVGLSLAAVRTAGALGLICADAANMALRIAYSLAFARRHFAAAAGGFRLRALAPRRASLAAYATAAAAACASRVLLLPESSAVAAWAQRRGLAPAPLLAAVARLPPAARSAAHASVGVASLAAVAATLYACERDVVRELRELRRGYGEDAAGKGD